MATLVLYPKVSLETSSGRIARWRVAEGDRVTPGQVLFEIDNDKAAVEVAATADGIIRGLTPETDEVTVGDAVATILAAGEVLSGGPAASRTADASDAAERQPQPSAARPAAEGRLPLPTPLARRIARDHGLSLAGLAGSGPRGRVQRKDVLAHLASLAAGAAAPTAARGTLAADWLRRGPAPGLVLIHGFAADLNSWRGLLAAARFDAGVLAVDLPGHGRSPRDVPADLDGLAAAVEDTVIAHGAAPAVLAGHSFGGLVAARIAARGRIALRGLALFAPAGLGPAINGDFLAGILRATTGESLRPWLQELVHDPALVSEVFVNAMVEARRDTGLTAAQRRFAEIFLPEATQRHAIGGDLGRIAVPVRVVFGRNDRILRFGDTAGLPGHVALHAVPECGHLPHLEHPALSAGIVAEMLRAAR